MSNSLTLELNNPTELRLAAAFLTTIADAREGDVHGIVTERGDPLDLDHLTGAAGDRGATADNEGFALRHPSGEQCAVYKTPEELASALITAFQGAADSETADKLFQANAAEMRKLGKALLDEVTLAYGVKASGLKPAAAETAPAATTRKRQSRKQPEEKQPAAAPAAPAPTTSDGTSLFDEVGEDAPKPGAATATVAAGSTQPQTSAPASAKPATSAPAGSPDEKAVYDVMMAFIKKVGFAKGVEFMKRFNAKRFTEIGKEHWPRIHKALTDPAIFEKLVGDVNAEF